MTDVDADGDWGALLPGDANDPEWVPELLEALASGMSLHEWTGRRGFKKDRDGRPSAWAVQLWQRRSVSGKDRFNAARAAGAELLIAKINAAVEGPGDDVDTMVRVGRDRLRADNYRWLAGVWNPDYAQKQRVEQTGNIRVTVVTGVPDGVPRETLADADRPRITLAEPDNAGRTCGAPDDAGQDSDLTENAAEG